MSFNRIAVLSDIHANREAFTAVIEDAALQGTDGIVILGDIIGYGPDPEWCVDRAIRLVSQGALCVMGNHDDALARTNTLNPLARAAMDWTRPRLSDTQRAFLADLPITLRLHDILFTHASAHSPRDWIYIDGLPPARASFRLTDARIILCGHVHRPALYSCDMRDVVQAHRVPIGDPLPLLTSRRWLGVVGAVGQPRDGVPQAGYAILDRDADELTFRRVPYDVATTARKVRDAGLPDALAARLLIGL